MRMTLTLSHPPMVVVVRARPLRVDILRAAL